MSNITYKGIEDCLGEKNKRYFSEGFKHIDYKYEKLNIKGDKFSGSVFISCDWEYKQNRHCHIGTVEYIAIALFASEKFLKESFSLSDSDISRSWVSSFRMKIRECIPLENGNKTSFTCSVKKHDNCNGQIINDFELRVNTNTIKYTIISTLSSKFRLDSTKVFSLFHEGYKKRTHCISEITLLNNMNECNALVKATYSPSC